MIDIFKDKKVACIGNAMSLFDLSYGKEIDSHDIVVRLNKAAMLVNRFDSSISHGTKTNVWIFWSVVEYQSYFSTIDKNIIKVHAGHQFRNSEKIKQVDYVYPNEYYIMLKKIAGSRKNPTTGFIAIDYILKSNPTFLSVYGFDWKETPTHTDPLRKKEKLCPHNFDIEKKYLQDNVFILDNVILRN